MAGVKKAKLDLTKKVHEVPHKPGVYLMRDRFNRVIYVGKARALRANPREATREASSRAARPRRTGSGARCVDDNI